MAIFRKFIITILACLFLMAPVSSSALVEIVDGGGCLIQGKITKVGAGVYRDTELTNNNKERDIKIKFTELQIALTSAKPIPQSSGKKIGCNINEKAKKTFKYGLCYDIDVFKGDKIKAVSAPWLYSPRCLFEVMKK